MKCPDCDDVDRQKRLGQVAYSSAILYHCEACDHLYAIEREPEQDEQTGDED